MNHTEPSPYKCQQRRSTHKSLLETKLDSFLSEIINDIISKRIRENNIIDRLPLILQLMRIWNLVSCECRGVDKKNRTIPKSLEAKKTFPFGFFGVKPADECPNLQTVYLFAVSVLPRH